MTVRHRALIALAALTACSMTPRVGVSEPLDRCETTDCFNQNRIRDFEVIDETTLIVYVGAKECPFLVEFSGVFCDLTYLPGFDVVFEPSRQRAVREPRLGGGFGSRTDIAFARVCSDSLDMGIAQGPFTSAVGDDSGGIDGLSCTVQNVESLTDDEIMEIYVDKRFAQPPPPFGTGDISVEEPESGTEGRAPEEGASAPSESTE